jgi:hypothetical protein
MQISVVCGRVTGFFENPVSFDMGDNILSDWNIIIWCARDLPVVNTGLIIILV